MTGTQMSPRINQSIREGLRVSQTSLAWTMFAGAGAIAVGVLGNSLVLIAFGAIGLLDAVGSGSLITHFRHARRHEAISELHERRALIVVTIGMATIGLATIGDSVYRLSARTASDPLPAGIALAGASVLMLTLLASRKRKIARRIPSHALHADGWLSAMGAVLALIALAGTGLDAAFGWWWIDSLAAIAVGCEAIGLSTVLARGPHPT